MVLPGPATGQLHDEIEHLEVLDAAEQHRQHQERQHHRDGDGPELPPFAGAVTFGGFVDAVRDRAQTRKADQHDEGRPHPGVGDHDGPWRQMHIADHRKAGRISAGEEGDDIVEQADLRLVEERPEIADNGGRQHHREAR